jgi:hypothetical protein
VLEGAAAAAIGVVVCIERINWRIVAAWNEYEVRMQ